MWRKTSDDNGIMERENCTDIDNEVKTNIDNDGRTNIDNEVRIHIAFIRFVLSRPWMRNVDYYKDIRSYEKKQRMKWLFENNKDSWYQTVGKLYKGIRSDITIPHGLSDDDITIILKEPLFEDTNNTVSVFAAAERIVPSILDYEKYDMDDINSVREIVIKEIFLSLNGSDKDWKSEFCLQMEEKYKTWLKEVKILKN